MWVLNEYGVAESWTKHYVYSQFSGNIAPFGFTLNNEFLFEAFNRHLALYDPVAAKVKSFKIMVGHVGISKIVQYVDSLIWVAPTERGISSCNISSPQI